MHLAVRFVLRPKTHPLLESAKGRPPGDSQGLKPERSVPCTSGPSRLRINRTPDLLQSGREKINQRRPPSEGSRYKSSSLCEVKPQGKTRCALDSGVQSASEVSGRGWLPLLQQKMRGQIRWDVL